MPVKSYTTEKEEGSDKTFTVWYPEGKTACPLVLFAHGYSGSASSHDYMATKIAEDGYVVVIADREDDDKYGFPGIFTFMMFATPISQVSVDGSTMQAAFDYVVAASKDESSPLPAGVVDTDTVIAGGFSMGGVEAISFAASEEAPTIKALLLVSASTLMFGTVAWRMSQSKLAEKADALECPTLYVTSSSDMAAVSAFKYAARGKDTELVHFKSEVLNTDCPNTLKTSWANFMGIPGKMLGVNDHFALACEEGPTYKAILPFLKNALTTGKSGELDLDPSLLAPKEMTYSSAFQFIFG